MAGTTGNLGWAESGVEPVTEPLDALKADGFAFQDPWAAENANWQLQRLGRASLPRFASTELLVQARRSGTGPPEEREDVGLVEAFAGRPGYSPAPWGIAWSVGGDATELDIAADGEFTWTTPDFGGASYFLRCLARLDGNLVVEASTPGQRFNYQFVATAGGNVYTADDLAGVPQLQARSRVDCTELYNVPFTAGAAVVHAVATDGLVVAIAAGNLVELFIDTGAALVSLGSYNHGAQINCLAMDGSKLVLGGVISAGFEIEVLTYGPLGPAPYMSMARGATVNFVDFDGRSILFSGAISGANFAGLFWSVLSAAPDWNVAVATDDVKIVGDQAVLAQAGAVYVVDMRTGLPSETILWDAGAPTQVERLAWDNDALFVLGDLTATGRRRRRYEVRNQPQLFAVQVKDHDFTLSSFRAVHSLVQPVR